MLSSARVAVKRAAQPRISIQNILRTVRVKSAKA